MKTYSSLRRMITAMLALVLAASVFGIVGLQALAQGNAPTQVPYPTQTPYPTNTLYPTYTPLPPQEQAATESSESAGQTAGDSDVKWVASPTTFESLYPAGFRFTAKITSSAGPLTRGRVIWSHAPGTQRSRPAQIDPDTGTLTAVWEATGADAVPPWVGLDYYWDVSDAAGNNFQTEPEYAEYADTSREWIRTESEDIIVFTENLPEETGPMVVEAMAAQRETYRAAWGDLLPYVPRAILFGDRTAWEEWQISAVNPRVIGTTSNDWGGTVQVVSGDNLVDLAYGTVLHEIAHLYQGVYTVMAPGNWFIEGNATFFELHQMYDYEARVRQMAADGELPALLEGSGPGQSGRMGYDIGYTFWKWLVDNYGLEGHRQLIQLIDSGTRRDEALETVTGLSLQEIESRWRVWLGASSAAPTLIPTPTLLTFPTITPFTFGK